MNLVQFLYQKLTSNCRLTQVAPHPILLDFVGGRRPASVFDEIFQLVFYIYVYDLLKIFITIFAGNNSFFLLKKTTK